MDQFRPQLVMEQLCIEFDTFQIVTHILRLGPEGLSGLLQAPESPVVDAGPNSIFRPEITIGRIHTR